MQVDVTGQREKNTTYTNTNTNGNGMMILSTWRCTVTTLGGVATAQAKSDTASPPTEIASGVVGVQAGLLNEDNTFQLAFFVEPGATYRVDTVETAGVVTKDKWFEVYFN